MFSVTSEAATNVSFQSAPPRAAHGPTQPPGNDIFGAWSTATPPATPATRAAHGTARNRPRHAAPTTRRRRNNSGSQNAARRPTSRPTTIPDNSGRRRRPATNAECRHNANARPASHGEVRQLRKPTAAKSTAKSSSGDDLRYRFFNRSRRLGAAGRHDARSTPNAGRGCDSRHRRGDGNAPRSSADLRQCHGAAGDRGGGHRRQLQPAAASAAAAASAQTKIDADAAAADIADRQPQPPRTRLRSPRIRQQPPRRAFKRRQASRPPRRCNRRPRHTAATVASTAVAATAPVAPKDHILKAAAATQAATATSGSSDDHARHDRSAAAATAQPAAATGNAGRQRTARSTRRTADASAEPSPTSAGCRIGP